LVTKTLEPIEEIEEGWENEIVLYAQEVLYVPGNLGS
jgi:hypothetical protein